MKNLNQQMRSYIKERPAVDRQLKGETMVEFEGKGKNTKIKKITPPMPQKKMPEKKQKSYSKTYNV